jgi:hypothetical protein
MTTIDLKAETEAVIKTLNAHALWVAVSVKRPRMNYKVSGAVVSISDGEETKTVDQDLMQSPRWKLLPDDVNERFNELESKARRALSKSAIGFPAIRGISLLPITRAGEAISTIKGLNGELQAEREAFTNAYDDLLTNLRDKMGTEAFDSIRHRLPTKELLVEHFGIQCITLPIGGGSSFDKQEAARCLDIANRLLQKLDMTEDTVRLQSFLTSLVEGSESQTGQYQALIDADALDLVESANKALHDHIGGFVDELVEKARLPIAAAGRNLIEMLREEKVIRGGSLDKLRRAIDFARGFSFLGGNLPTLLQEADRLIQGFTPQELNADRDLGRRLADALEPVVRQVVNPDVIQQDVECFRRICVVPRPEKSDAKSL